MTRDEVFKLAEEAGFGCCWEDTDLDCGLIWWSDEKPLDEELLRFAALVAQAERKPLTDAEILDVWKPFEGNPFTTKYEFARAIERAHCIGSEE